jgi:Fe-S oxidoreductase/nitrate reductase gamma subunit
MTSQAIPQNKTSSRLDEALVRAKPRLRSSVPDFFIHVLGQIRILKKIYPGIMHFLIFWGVTIQVIGTAINLMQMQLFLPFVLTFPRNNLYLAYELIMDLAGVAILIGVTMALLRRIAFPPKALETSWDDIYALILLGLIPIVGFIVEGCRLLATSPAWANWSPVGNLVAHWMSSLGMTPQAATNLHDGLMWVHATLALILVASIPFTKLRHLLYAPLNILFRPLRKPSELTKIENIEETELLGVGKVNEFTSQQLLSFDACVRCGRCEEACPATMSGMSYSPRDLIQMMRQAMVTSLQTPDGKTTHELFGEAISDEYPWSCTTCGACLIKCPAFINPVDEVIDLRRYQALTTGKIPKSVADTLRNMERQGNPWGMPPDDRLKWAEGLEVRELAPGDETDVLLFLGCASAYDDRNKKVAQSFVRLLQKAGVDFGILGFDETCCGETARRMGNEYMFQVFAEQNIETLSKIKFKRIVTQCPHCYNTLKNEYPQLGGHYNVLHSTELLTELSLPWDKISPNGNGVHGRVSYHDSCYLGRYNQIYTEPRKLLKEAHITPIELPRHGENSFCCGGGGGQMWLETDPNTRINHHRLADAIQAQADIVTTACPYCLLMFDDAIRSKGVGDKIQVMDISEVLEKQLST